MGFFGRLWGSAKRAVRRVGRKVVGTARRLGRKVVSGAVSLGRKAVAIAKNPRKLGDALLSAVRSGHKTLSNIPILGGIYKCSPMGKAVGTGLKGVDVAKKYL